MHCVGITRAARFQTLVHRFLEPAIILCPSEDGHGPLITPRVPLLNFLTNRLNTAAVFIERAERVPTQPGAGAHLGALDGGQGLVLGGARDSNAENREPRRSGAGGFGGALRCRQDGVQPPPGLHHPPNSHQAPSPPHPLECPRSSNQSGFDFYHLYEFLVVHPHNWSNVRPGRENIL